MSTPARTPATPAPPPAIPATAPAQASGQDADLYRHITERIAAQIAAGAGRFHMPWHQDGAVNRPVNIVSRLPYRGINTLLLWLTAQEKGYTGGEWGTYKQFQDKGGQVHRGEKATHIVFWKCSDPDNELTHDAPEDAPAGEVISRDDWRGHRVLARTYPVFHADQVDDYQPRAPRVLPDTERVAHAEEFLESAGVPVRHGGNRAFYAPQADEIVLPPFERFRDPLAYYAVRAHETVHATGHPSRLDRQFGARYGEATYAMEELTAELGAAFLCADLGLTNQPHPEHAQYAATWLKVFGSDPKALFVAAGRAQQAADWLHDQHVLRFIPEENYDQIGLARRGGAFKQAGCHPGL